jgi:hypothetical protein
MSVHEFELFHGVVLTKLVRSDRPMTLRLIETSANEAWVAYTINTTATLFMKHSTKSRVLKREKALSWSFVFSPKDLAQIKERGGNAYVALICGLKKVQVPKMEICFLTAEQVNQLLDTEDSRQQAVTVKAATRKRLRVSSSRIESELLVPQSALESWEVPGS